MAKTVNLYQAKTHLSALVDEAAAGAEVVIAKNGKPKAKLVPMPRAQPAPGLRPIGFYKRRVWESPDCWDPMSEEELKLGYEGGPGDPPREASDR